MKKLIILFIAVTNLILVGCETLSKRIPTVISETNGLTIEEIVIGLKEALYIGAKNSVLSASAANGFYGNPQIYVPFPPEAIKVKHTLEQAGFSHLITDFEKSLNRAAEEASGKALPIFMDAITGLTITDAIGILRGPDNAATMYLKLKTETDLKKEFIPIVKIAIQTTDVTSYWNPIALAYNRIARFTGGSQVNPNLEEYITQKSLDGLFLLMEKEEKEIRQNPASRVTDILRKVFYTK
ncbi:MAG: DUF4197 domain-containing protein [Candidatus Loosdrechtia sp.]|uniref:DUF4197 domain-containing protein n=1 Tax=Candidatus Loosdrechtia sp. TaxID=3101272 RepID=UPI003A6EDE0E|nr:MAG: DUF4197 domain-containing protein [Candidatus Jettenia sp. AMX2]